MPIAQTISYRHHLKKFTRDYFSRRGYLEVDTPVITICPGTEVHLQYFDTSWVDFKGIGHKRFLRSSPELHMKRLVAQGAGKIFQLGPCFRNHGELSPWHNPEFFMLEWYQVGQSYLGLIEETESFLRETADAMASITGVPSDKVLPQKIERIRVADAFIEFAGIPLVDGDPDLAGKAVHAGVISVRPADNFETAFFKILIEVIEPALARLGACVLYDYPPSQAALAVVEDGRACRFEFYVGRVELCNGFYELTGEQENRSRALDAMRAREACGYDSVPLDEDFFKAMSSFSSPCSGNALGFDRWVTLLANADSLDVALAFRGV
jgi:lysyl-tRNA synthetase class 2